MEKDLTHEKMISDKLAIVLYTSTKGHFGFKNCYKYTVRRMAEVIPLFHDFYKIVHIKVSEGEEKQAEEMVDWLYGWGFKVISSKG